jgi:hypothetical protein
MYIVSLDLFSVALLNTYLINTDFTKVQKYKHEIYIVQ